MESLKSKFKGKLLTCSGIVFDLQNPKLEDIQESDIAHALAHMPRWGGHLPNFLSVAQHSIIVALLVEKHFKRPDLVLQALLHDASEAYLMDIPSTLKPLIPHYKPLEMNLQHKIFTKFEVPLEMDLVIKEADNMALDGEYQSLMLNRSNSLEVPGLAYPFTLMNSQRARIAYLAALESAKENMPINALALLL